MTGPEHYLVSEQLAEMAEQRAHAAITDKVDVDAIAQVFATLSLSHAQMATAAAVALQAPGGEDAGMRIADIEEWEGVASATSTAPTGPR